MRALNQIPSLKNTVVVFPGWDLSLKEGYCARRLMIKYAGFCQNNSRYLKVSAAGTHTSRYCVAS